jgi:glycosyltransferase involved in cell wall biosynthesis
LPHVAYIAWGFPPSRSGGAYRQLATANALAAEGWDVTVLTVERAVFTDITGADLSLEDRIDPRIRVLRTRFPWPLRNQDRASWSPLHRLAPRLWRKARLAFELAVFPEVGYATWKRTLERALGKLERERGIDLVVASGNPFAAFAAAWSFHRRSGRPYVLDYRDSWTLDQFSGRARYRERDRAARWERRVIAAAAQVWFVNRAMEEWHAARYPAAAARFRVAPNGWDPDLLQLPDAVPPAPAARSLEDGAIQAAAPCPAPERPDGAAGAEVRRRLTFGYLGTISGRVPLEALVEGWRLALAGGGLPAGSRLLIAGYLGFFGGRCQPPQEAAAALLEEAAGDGVEFVGPVPKTQVGEFYASLDGLVLAIDAGRFVTTGKVFEYVATGKPVVSVHPPEAATSDVLAGYPLWSAVERITPPEVAAALTRAAATVEALTPEQTAAARAHGARYTRARQLGPAIAGLRTLLG